MAQESRHDFQHALGNVWSFEKAMMDFSPKAPSTTSSIDFAELHDDSRLVTTSQDIKQTIVEHASPAVFNDRYMSSEEQLSPAEHDSDYDDLDDDDSVFEIGIAAPLRFTVCDMAVAICVVAAGQPKIVDVASPMQKLSASVARRMNFGRASWMPQRSSSLEKPQIKPRNVNRPALPTLYSVPTMVDVHTTTTNASTVPSTAPSTASDTSPILSQASATPPTSSYTDTDSQGSPRSSLYNTFSTTSSPKKQFSIDRSTTSHSFLEHDPYENSSPPTARKHSRFRNLSQKWKLRRVGKSTAEADESLLKSPEKTSFDSITPVTVLEPLTPTRRRLVARGAAEREPIIQIPPCPYDVDDDGSLILNSPRRRRQSLGF